MNFASQELAHHNNDNGSGHYCYMPIRYGATRICVMHADMAGDNVNNLESPIITLYPTEPLPTPVTSRYLGFLSLVNLHSMLTPHQTITVTDIMGNL